MGFHSYSHRTTRRLLTPLLKLGYPAGTPSVYLYHPYRHFCCRSLARSQPLRIQNRMHHSECEQQGLTRCGSRGSRARARDASSGSTMDLTTTIASSHARPAHYKTSSLPKPTTTHLHGETYQHGSRSTYMKNVASQTATRCA